jgi:hypothetical protein
VRVVEYDTGPSIRWVAPKPRALEELGDMGE